MVRTGERPYSPHGSLSPPWSFCTRSSSCCTSACDTNAAEAKGTEKTRASSSCAASQPVPRNGRAEKQKRKNQSLEKFSFPLHKWGKVSTKVHLLQRNTDFFPVTSIYLCSLIIFLACKFNNWCDREIKLA